MKEFVKDTAKSIKECCIDNNIWWVVVATVAILSAMIDIGIVNKLGVHNAYLNYMILHHKDYALLCIVWDTIVMIPTMIWAYIALRNMVVDLKNN